ncbi:MAG: hypothetical protein FVQ77_12345, partial [Cytophagales bacterium]|nr:hypothetical protein [Cytophagales bacterium]
SLLAGVYSIIVRDSLLCEITVSATVNNTTTLFLTVDSVTNVSCPGGSDGVIYTSATGGTPPYEFKIDGGSFQPDSTFTGLPANTYDTIVVRDFSSCIYTISQTISEPSALVISVDSITGVNCNGGADGIIYTSAIGGTPPYEFSNDSGSSYQSDSAFTGLTATNYDIIVRDANLCTDTIFSQIIPEPSILIVSVDSITGVSCNGGSDGIIYLSAAGGTPLYEFSNDNGGSYQSDSTFTGLTATSYDIIVRDALLCTDTLTAIVTEPAILSTSISGFNNVRNL